MVDDFEYCLSNDVKDHFQVDVNIECDKYFSRLYFPRVAGKDRAAAKYAGVVTWKKGREVLSVSETGSDLAG